MFFIIQIWFPCIEEVFVAKVEFLTFRRLVWKKTKLLHTAFATVARYNTLLSSVISIHDQIFWLSVIHIQLSSPVRGPIIHLVEVVAFPYLSYPRFCQIKTITGVERTPLSKFGRWSWSQERSGHIYILNSYPKAKGKFLTFSAKQKARIRFWSLNQGILGHGFKILFSLNFLHALYYAYRL